MQSRKHHSPCASLTKTAFAVVDFLWFHTVLGGLSLFLQWMLLVSWLRLHWTYTSLLEVWAVWLDWSSLSINRGYIPFPVVLFCLLFQSTAVFNEEVFYVFDWAIYFVDTIMNNIFSNFSMSSLLLYRNAIDFCKLIFILLCC